MKKPSKKQLTQLERLLKNMGAAKVARLAAEIRAERKVKDAA